MLRDRKDYPRLYTPRGTGIWPALNEPDYKFKANGEWHARLRLAPDTPGLAELVATAEQILDEAYEAKKSELLKDKKGALLKELKKALPVVKPEVDMETGEETGFVILRAALPFRIDIKNGPKAGTSFEKKPDLFNAKGQQLKNPPKIGNGSELKLSVTPMDYWFPKDKTIGVSFELNAVQVLRAVDSGGQRSADFYGFGEEEGDDIQDGEAGNGGAFQDEVGENPDF